MEKVVDVRDERGVVEYLVCWEGYEEMTWEREEEFVSMDPVMDFWEEREGRV